MTESEFQSAVIEYAKMRGWMVMHTRPAQVRPGRWATPLSGNPGFPDLVLVRPVHGDVVFAELKKDGGRLSVGQKAWLTALKAAGAEVYIWYPDDMEAIVRRLGRTPS
jgi:hypothetical protein